MTITVQLKAYEGPLDLLLDLIKENKIDIYDIPIAEITDQYMAYLEKMKELNLAVAGDFLVMAATLVYIKSKMLLPPDEVQDDEEEEIDPRTDLVNKLLEYQAFKEAARDLDVMQEQRRLVFTRAQQLIDLPQDEHDELGLPSNLFDFIQAFSNVLKTNSIETFHEIYEEDIPIDKKLDEISTILDAKGSVRFSELFSAKRSRNILIVTFLAILELIKAKRIRIEQSALFEEIVIFKQMVMVQRGKEQLPAPDEQRMDGHDG